MKKTNLVLYVAIGLVVALLIGSLAILPSLHTDESNTDMDSTSDTHISVTIPTTPQHHGTVENEVPQIEDFTHEQAEDKKPTVNDIEYQDAVVSESKDKNTVESGPSSGEDRNDEILQEKENQAPSPETISIVPSFSYFSSAALVKSNDSNIISAGS